MPPPAARLQVTRQGGMYAKESPDGRDLYYADASASLPSVWRVPVSGGDEQVLVENVNRTSNFAVAREGLYFESAAPEKGRYQALLSIPVTRPGFIDYLSFATGKVTRMLTLDRIASGRA